MSLKEVCEVMMKRRKEGKKRRGLMGKIRVVPKLFIHGLHQIPRTRTRIEMKVELQIKTGVSTVDLKNEIL